MRGPTQLEVRCGDCLLYGAIEGMTEGLVLVDAQERVFHLNRKAREFLELSSRHVVGTKIRSALAHQALVGAFWATASKENGAVTTEITLPSGVVVTATVSPCLSAAREPIGKALLLRDVTREKKIRLELSDSVAKRLLEMTGGDGSHESLPPLTGRELQILELLAEGLTNAGIASRLHVSPNTVASHLKNIYAKLHVNNRAQAVSVVLSHGIRIPVRQ